MRNVFIILCFLLLTGCSFFSVHKMDIEQGNVMTQDTVNKIHRGMTAEEVKDIMGNPVLSNVFDGNRMDYVYTFKPGYGEGTEKFVTVIFKHGRVSDIEGNLYSTFMR